MRTPMAALLSLVVILLTPTLAMADSPGFGPWDSGAEREVSRKGRKGKARVQHPMVGSASKVPASGPPLPPLRLDVDIHEQVRSTANRPASALSSNPLFLAALFYRNFLTKVDGARCQHLPTCSRLANQAVARHGLLGILMGLDRIIQDDASSVLRRLPMTPFGEGMRMFDPLENYQWWKPSFQAFPPASVEEPMDLSAKTPRSAP